MPSDESTSFQRAHHADQKAARRQSILDAAARRFAQDPLPDISIASVAREAGLAKGSVYRYFATREEIFLALLQGELDRWLDALDAWLARDVPARSPAQIATHMVDALRQEETLLRLLARLFLQLEENLSHDAALAFKSWLLTRLASSGVLLEQALGVELADLTHAESDGALGARQLLRFSALCAGLWPMANPAGAMAEVLAMEEMAPLRLDFFTELSTCFEAILATTTRAPVPRRASEDSFPWSI